MARPPRIPNWLPWEQRSVYFITFCIERRRPVLANPGAWEICLRIFSRLDEWTTLAAIAMPDHLHALVAPLDRDASVAAFSKWFKRWFDEEYCRVHCRASVPDAVPIHQTWKWQEGCFDRLLRSDESLSDKWEYLRQNPVRAGLVVNPEDWPFQFASTGDKL
jgi:REP element-mobilizing transposase RayT